MQMTKDGNALEAGLGMFVKLNKVSLNNFISLSSIVCINIVCIVCLYECMYTYGYACVHVCMHNNIYIRIHICTYAGTYLCIY